MALAGLEMCSAEGMPVQRVLFEGRPSARAKPYFIFPGSWYSIRWA